jgi:diadenosine tetraphosphate (Ap4A) HIT family hydrolase
MPAFELHPRLRADCHELGALQLSRVLLSRNASVPWFIMVPEVDQRITEWHELDVGQRHLLDAEVCLVARYARASLGATKINVAAIGNVVPQLHIHVVGRRPDDPCWPGVVWGSLPPGPAWPAEQLAKIWSGISAANAAGE